MDGIPAIRDGVWKLILGHDPGFATREGGNMKVDEIQLYDLAADLGEQNNVAAEHPDRVAAMKVTYEKLIAAGRSTPTLKE